MQNFKNTSLGAVYAFWITNRGDKRTVYEAHNDLLATMLNSSRLGIPVTFVQETLHGATGGGAVFPMPISLGASWDADLLQAVGGVIGVEARAVGVDRGFSPELQVDTDPRFGRTEEAFGEDPTLVGVLGAAMAKGMMGNQTGGPDTYLSVTEGIATEAKHYFAYGNPGRDNYAVDLSDRTLFDVYLRPWKRFAAVGGRGVMLSHQEVNGVPNHMNKRFVTGVWRGLFGANNSFVASDYSDVGQIPNFGVAVDCDSASAFAINAGLDQDLGNRCYGDSLPKLVQSGAVSTPTLDRAVGNILRSKFAAGLFDGAGFVNASLVPEVLDSPPHRALAYRAAAESAVLLVNKDNKALPLKVASLREVAVIGPNAGCPDGKATCDATAAQLGGYSNAGSKIVTVLEAVQTAAARAAANLNTTRDADTAAAALSINVQYARGANIDDYNTSMIAEAVVVAKAADVAIVVVGDSADGYAQGSCAEGIDADSLDLPGSQLALLDALTTQTTTPIIVVLINGRPATFGAGPFAFTGSNNALVDRFAALLVAGRPGEVGGQAIWDILTGAVNPSGRLAQNWVRHVGAIRSPANPWFQQRGGSTSAFVSEPSTPLFPFGFGLSYTQFVLKSATVNSPSSLKPGDVFTVTALVTSSGPAGKVVVQVYASQNAPTKYVRYTRWLLCFSKADVPADSSSGVHVVVTCEADDLEGYDPDVGNYVLFPGTYTLSTALVSTDQGVSNTVKV